MARSFSQLEKKEQIMICIVLPLAVAAAIGYFGWKIIKDLGPDPKLPSFLHRPDGIWTQINATEQSIMAEQAVVNRAESVRKQLESLQDEIALAEQRLPLEAEKTLVRQLIEDLARNVPDTMGVVQLKAVTIQAGGAVKGEDYQPITYRTEIMGDLNGIIKYIDQIEKNTRFMMVRNFSIKPGGLSIDSEKQVVVSALHSVNLDIVTYVYNPSSGAARRRKTP